MILSVQFGRDCRRSMIWNLLAFEPGLAVSLNQIEHFLHLQLKIFVYVCINQLFRIVFVSL